MGRNVIRLLVQMIGTLDARNLADNGAEACDWVREVRVADRI